MIGYDLDGVICKEPRYLPLLFRVSPKIGVFFRSIQPLLYFPIYPGVIVTGRPECDREITKKWLWSNQISYTELFMAKHPSYEETIKLKSETINRLRLSKFIESELEQIEELVELCPNCSFFLPLTAGNYLYRR